jgi:hypothetical protein
MSMAEATTPRTPVRLTFQDGQVMVTPKDWDIFFISAEKATEACSNVIRDEQRVAKFKEELLWPLAKWCEQHKDSVSACYVLPAESAVLPVYVIGAGEQYDFALAEKLTQFTVWFLDEKGWAVHISQIPLCDGEALAAFFRPETALQVYG